MPGENTEPKQRGRPFTKGVSGNPAGKPRGTRHRATQLAERLMSADLEDVTRAVIGMAKAGDMTAARLILERLVPVRKGRPVPFDLPAMDTAADVSAAIGAVVAAVADGALSPEEGQAVAGILEARRKAIETVDIEARLAALEAVQGAGGA